MPDNAIPPATVPAEIHAAITDLIARMNRALDDEAYEAYLALYADDAAFDPGLAPAVAGTAAIRDFLQAGQRASFITGKRHVAANIVLDAEAGRVTARYDLLVFERIAAPALLATACITDVFERHGGAWIAVSHVTRVDPSFGKAPS